MEPSLIPRPVKKIAKNILIKILNKNGNAGDIKIVFGKPKSAKPQALIKL